MLYGWKSKYGGMEVGEATTAEGSGRREPPSQDPGSSCEDAADKSLKRARSELEIGKRREAGSSREVWEPPPRRFGIANSRIGFLHVLLYTLELFVTHGLSHCDRDHKAR